MLILSFMFVPAFNFFFFIFFFKSTIFNQKFRKIPDIKSQDLPEGVLYKVKATYKYNQEDTDELSFDVGDEICVIEYDDPEEQVIFKFLYFTLEKFLIRIFFSFLQQEEGWLMGYKETTKEKGMFPANFTKPI